jgi:imidazolonepropionase-like amidohydrolase
MHFLIILLLSIAGTICYGQGEAYDLVIRNVGLFDGENDRGVVNIAIRGEHIAEITTETLEGNTIIDGTGKYLVPGMVNAHVHASEPGHLKEGYPLGILANLNMHTGLEQREVEWKKIARDSAGYAFLFGAGHACTVPGGHPTQFSPDMETIDGTITIEEWVDRRITNGADYIKIIRENHPWLEYPGQPTLTYDQIRQVIEYTHQRGFKAVVHATQARDFVEIAQFKPDGFVHMWDFRANSDISEEDFRAIANSGAFIVPTSGIALKEPPPFMKPFIERSMIPLEQRLEAIRKFHETGISIVAGTDAQDGQMNFGDDLYLELEVYRRAGLSNLEVLRTVTGNAALAFDLPVGLLKVGGNASMVLLDGNPLDDLANLKKVEQIWKNGRSN